MKGAAHAVAPFAGKLEEREAMFWFTLVAIVIIVYLALDQLLTILWKE